MTKQKQKIVPDEWYTLSEMVNGRFFPFLGKNHPPYLRIVNADLKGKNYLKTIVTGTGNGKRYTIQGKNIISFLHLIENGKIKV